MGEKERHALIGRAFSDKVLLQKLSATKDLNEIKNVAADVNINLTDADAKTLATNVIGIVLSDSDPHLTEKLGAEGSKIFVAIGKAKKRYESSES